MKRILILLLMLVIVLGCSSQTDKEAWNTGTDGITFTFVANNPPAKIRADDITVAIEYFNKGTYSPNQLTFRLHGYDPSILFGAREMSYASPKLESKSKFNPEGSQVYFAEWSSGITKPAGRDDFQQHLFVTACYDYKTLAGATLCIDAAGEDYDKTSAARCTAPVSGLLGSQGAPMAITAITQSVEDGVLYLQITVENKGGGTPFTSSLGDCTALNRNDENTFKISASISEGNFVCQPQATAGRVRIDSNKVVVLCEKPTSLASYTTTPLEVRLEYNYALTKNKLVTISR